MKRQSLSQTSPARSQRTFPATQRDLVAASLLVRPDRLADAPRVELSWPRS